MNTKSLPFAHVKVFHMKTLDKIHRTCEKIYEIWLELFDEKSIKIRSLEFQKYVEDFLSQIVENELELKDTVVTQINEYKQQVQRMQIILKTEGDSKRPLKFKNITEEHLYYEKTLKDLTNLKYKNQSYLKELKTQESQLCQALSENEIDIPNGSLVGCDELEVLEEHIRELKNEEEERLNEIKTIAKDVKTLFAENRIILNEKSSLNQLHSSKKPNIDKRSINRYRKSLEKIYTQREELVLKTDKLSKEIDDMWKEFGHVFNLIEPSLINIVRGQKMNSDYTMFNYQALQVEYDRCINLKRLLHKDYIEDLRDNIRQLWDDYFYDRPDRKEFEKLIDEKNITDELYDKHRQYVDKLNEYGQKHSSLLSNLKKWISLWKQFVDFDIDYSDPHRFSSSRYNSLFEEKQRNKFSLELPRLERAVKRNVADYFKFENAKFIIEEMEVEEFFEVNKAYHEDYKNTMRMTRQLELKQVQKSISTPIKPKIKTETEELINTIKEKQKKFENVRASIFSPNIKANRSRITGLDTPKKLTWMQNNFSVKKEKIEPTNLQSIKGTKKDLCLKKTESSKVAGVQKNLKFSSRIPKVVDTNVSKNSSKAKKRVSTSKYTNNFKQRCSNIRKPNEVPEIIVTQYEEKFSAISSTSENLTSGIEDVTPSSK